MTHTDWKQWTISQPDWTRKDIEELLEKFVEQKWNDALNLATAEPVNRDAAGVKLERSVTEKPAGGTNKAWYAGGAAGVTAIEAIA